MIKNIEALPLFSQLPADKIKRLLSEHQLYSENYGKGATLYNQNDRCRTLDIILEGRLVAYSLTETGSYMTVFEFSKGHILGANLLFGDTDRYPFSIYCMGEAKLLHLSKKAVTELLQHHSFTMQFIKLLSLNSQKLNQRVSMATQRSLRENLLDYLRQQAILQHSDHIALPISKKQLADYLGVQRPSLFRTLKQLKDEGIIEVANRKILLKGPLELGETSDHSKV